MVQAGGDERHVVERLARREERVKPVGKPTCNRLDGLVHTPMGKDTNRYTRLKEG